MHNLEKELACRPLGTGTQGTGMRERMKRRRESQTKNECIGHHYRQMVFHSARLSKEAYEMYFRIVHLEDKTEMIFFFRGRRLSNCQAWPNGRELPHTTKLCDWHRRAMQQHQGVPVEPKKDTVRFTCVSLARTYDRLYGAADWWKRWGWEDTKGLWYTLPLGYSIFNAYHKGIPSLKERS